MSIYDEPVQLCFYVQFATLCKYSLCNIISDAVTEIPEKNIINGIEIKFIISVWHWSEW